MDDWSKTICDARDLYFRESLDRTAGNSEGLWASVSHILHPNPTSGVQGRFDLEGAEVSDDLMIAEKFNECIFDLGRNLAAFFPMNIALLRL